MSESNTSDLIHGKTAEQWDAIAKETAEKIMSYIGDTIVDAASIKVEGIEGDCVHTAAALDIMQGVAVNLANAGLAIVLDSMETDYV